MADRYWVLGTGSWDSTTTTNWSATSGGAGGASVPTAADNVIFNVNSNVTTTAFTVTMANNPRVCLDLTITGLDGVLTLAGSIGLTISGSLSVVGATLPLFTHTGATTFNATTTGKTVTTNGATFTGNIIFNGVGGEWTLGSSLTTPNTVTVTNGTFSTSASNYAVTANNFSSDNSNTRTISLNNSTITLSSSASAWSATTTTGLTFNRGNSLINCTSLIAPAFAGGGLTYWNVTFIAANIASTIQITGANTFNNLTVTAQSTTPEDSWVEFDSNQTITGTLTVNSGATAIYRVFLKSNIEGTARTITAAAVSLTDVDFQDITAAGAASPFTGTRLGDCDGNTNITFPVAKTVYFRQTGSANWGDANSWSATSGGAAAVTNFPLAQDTAVFPAATYPATASTVTINGRYNIGTVDMSLRTTNTMTLTNLTNIIYIFGNWINGTGSLQSTASGTLLFWGRRTQQITSAGISFSVNQGITQNNFTGTVQLQDNLTIGGLYTLTLGTLSLNSKTLTVGTFNTTNSNTRAIVFAASEKIVLTGTGTVWTTVTDTNLTITGTAVVDLNNNTATARTISLSNGNSSLISFNVLSGTGNVSVLNGAGDSLKSLDFTGFAGTWTATSTGNIYGNLTLATGMTLTASANAMTFAATSGTQTITSSGKTIDFPITISGGGTATCADALTLGSTRALTFSLGTLKLKSGVTSTVGSFVTSGTTLKYLQSSTPGTQATLSDASGTNTATYLFVQDSAATGGATWTATDATNVNAGNNSGWNFGATPGNFFFLFN
jgi:hypothetical protein